MIINVRGTSGSGKSHLVREVMKLYDGQMLKYVDGRKQPLYYELRKEGRRDLLVPGHYESPCGGCDTISKVESVFNLVRMGDEGGYDVLFEGLLLSADSKHLGALVAEGREVQVIALETTLQECLAAVQARRDARAAARGERGKPLNPRNTEQKWKQVRASVGKLREKGIPTAILSREDAFLRVRELLGV